MKIFAILLFSISVNAAAGPVEGVYFVKIPSQVSLSEAVNIISQAASRRRWIVGSFNNNQMRISLKHRTYKAVLIFKFFTNEVTYTDLTQQLDDDQLDGEEEWEATTAPKNWIRNLKADINRKFAGTVGRNAVKKEFTHKNIVAKLEALKRLFDKKLITERQYNKKRKEIMSRY